MCYILLKPTMTILRHYDSYKVVCNGLGLWFVTSCFYLVDLSSCVTFHFLSLSVFPLFVLLTCVSFVHHSLCISAWVFPSSFVCSSVFILHLLCLFVFKQLKHVKLRKTEKKQRDFINMQHTSPP